MKRILAWIMALCMALICVPLTATARAEDSASRASKYDYYCYMPNVYSDEITVTIKGKQYLRYPVKVCDLASVTSVGGTSVGGLIIDCGNLFLAYEADKITYVMDNVTTRESCFSNLSYSPLSGSINSSDYSAVRGQTTNTKTDSAYGTLTTYNFAFVSDNNAGLAPNADNEMACLYFAIPDLPDGTVLHFEFVNGIRAMDGSTFESQLFVIDRADMLSKNKTRTPIDFEQAHIGFINGTITMGTEPVATATPNATAAPTSTQTQSTTMGASTATPAATTHSTATAGTVTATPNGTCSTSHFWADAATLTAATCTAAGSKKQVCSNCGATQTAVIPALGHEMSDYQIVTAATCAATGVKRSTCSRCGYSVELAVPKDPNCHSELVAAHGVAATCIKAGLTPVCHCSACHRVSIPQTVIPALGHNWDAGVVITAATATQEGVMQYTCLRCGATKRASIPATNP